MQAEMDLTSLFFLFSSFYSVALRFLTAFSLFSVSSDSDSGRAAHVHRSVIPLYIVYPVIHTVTYIEFCV
jgi:hypothetical protein